MLELTLISRILRRTNRLTDQGKYELMMCWERDVLFTRCQRGKEFLLPCVKKEHMKQPQSSKGPSNLCVCHGHNLQ